MAEMVVSAVAQESVNRAVSFVLGNHEEMASKEHKIERLEMAVSFLGVALERSGKVPITDVSVLHLRRRLANFYMEGGILLTKLKRQEEGGQGVTCLYNFPRRFVTLARNLLPSSLLGFNVNVSVDVVQRFEQRAGYARDFLSSLESRCSLWDFRFCCYPLTRRLLQGTTLAYQLIQGSETLVSILVWPIRFEDRGVEAAIGYSYKCNARRPGKSFGLILILRLSESTDIVGIASNCLRALTSQFKLVTRSAIGELTQLPTNVQEVCRSYGFLPYIEGREPCRPDPLCCTANECSNDATTSELSHLFPEPVIFVQFQSYVSALKYSPRSTREVIRDWPPLKLTATFFPHTPFHDNLQKGVAVNTKTNEGECRICGIEQVGEMVRSKAIECLIRQPELKNYNVGWASRHGGASFEVEKHQPPRVSKRKR